MAYLNINRIIDVSSVISSTPPARRDFSVPLFVFKGEEVNSQRTNYFESYSDVVSTYGSNTEPAKAALKYFTGGFNGIKPKSLYIANFASTGTWSTVITELLSDPSYYLIACDNTFNQSDKEDLADAIEASTNIKYSGMFLTTDEVAASATLVADETSIAKTFYTNAYNQSTLFYDDAVNADEYKNMAAISYFATVDYTSARPLGCLAFKNMTGQTPSFSALTSAEISSYTTNLNNKYCNYYTAFGESGRNIFYKGITASNKFTDIVIGADWLDYNMTYEIFDLLVTLPKLSYTNADFNLLYSAMARVLEKAKGFGLISGGTDALTGIEYPNGYAISIPKPSEVSAADKANGVLNNVQVIAILSGNVVKITITNMLKY